MHSLAPLQSNVKSFTIVEVLIAMVVIVLTLSAAIMTTRGSLTSDQDSLDYGIAKHLANEGVEMVKNVIDTNLLKYSAYKVACWNYWKQREGDTGRCNESDATSHIVQRGFYTGYIDPDDKAMVLQGDNTPIDGTYANIDSANQNNFLLDKAEITGAGGIKFYVNRNNILNPDDAQYTNNVPTKFHRSIYITYDSNDDANYDNDNIDAVPNRFDDLILVSRVWWQGHGRVMKYDAKTWIANYTE